MKQLPDTAHTVVLRTDFSNMDFSEFADHVDGSGVFRGFTPG